MGIARSGLAAGMLAFLVLSGCAKPSPSTVEEADETAGNANHGLLTDIISIDFLKKAHTFTLAEVARGIQFDYTITVKEDINGVIPIPQDDGLASSPGPSGLCPFEQISGNGQSYSLRDIGLAPPREIPARTINKGQYPLSFEWDGRNWIGPSDFNNPKGDPFPPGEYTLTVRIVGELVTTEGKQPYRITSSVKIKLTH